MMCNQPATVCHRTTAKQHQFHQNYAMTLNQPTAGRHCAKTIVQTAQKAGNVREHQVLQILILTVMSHNLKRNARLATKGGKGGSSTCCDHLCHHLDIGETTLPELDKPKKSTKPGWGRSKRPLLGVGR
eukprot:TRINITY_DN55191_c0_g1_i1.p3 TRINITY_DN55191_c0_g1~~TRINITY_DN55191_c0_g1_i1.p3  ORF type:complete len:129 (+),score=20.43 TRINITY_DN55191_c0_g1_i1:604-990(+)